MRSNFIGTEFIIYDDGDKVRKDQKVRVSIRKELGIVMYKHNVLGSRGPRQMKAIIPAIKENNSIMEFKSIREEDTMIYK